MVSVSAAASADTSARSRTSNSVTTDTSARSRTSNSVTSKPDKGKDEPAPQRALPCVRAFARARDRMQTAMRASVRICLGAL
jgi:hypothetical protein